MEERCCVSSIVHTKFRSNRSIGSQIKWEIADTQYSQTTCRCNQCTSFPLWKGKKLKMLIYTSQRTQFVSFRKTNRLTSCTQKKKKNRFCCEIDTKQIIALCRLERATGTVCHLTLAVRQGIFPPLVYVLLWVIGGDCYYSLSAVCATSARRNKCTFCASECAFAYLQGCWCTGDPAGLVPTLNSVMLRHEPTVTSNS